MTRSENSEVLIRNVLEKTTDRKSSKKCRDKKCDAPRKNKDACEITCCIPDCNPECCTPAFQRLDKLRNYWLLAQYGLERASPTGPMTLSIPRYVNTRSGTSQAVPTDSTLIPASAGVTVYWKTLERQAFAFVNTVRYLNYEDCGKLDQVIGWSVDLQYGNLYLYQDLPDIGLLMSDSRSALINTSATSLTSYDRKKLAEMESFWKLSLKAVERVRENPKTEGNICEIKDKCGNRFLVAINRAEGQITNTYNAESVPPTTTYNGNSVCEYNSYYSIVVVKLC